MPRWVEIPLHRVLVVSGVEFAADYEVVKEYDGENVETADFVDRIIRRKSDGRLFRGSRDFGHGVRLWTGSDSVVLEER